MLVPSDKLQVLLITKNEEDNIQRVLDKLFWVEKVLIIDSYSDDKTIEIIESYPNTQIVYRPFDTFANQCNYGISLISSEWILSMDADYVLTDEFVIEAKTILSKENDSNVAYFVRFHYLIYGEKLMGNNTTPRAVLFKKNKCKYYDDGHAHRLEIKGETGFFTSYILHDDRKSLSRWLNNQDKYSIRECEKLLDPKNNSTIIKIRKTKILAPFLVFFYCLIGKGLIFNGWVGWYYTLQRTMVEILFSIRLIENEIFFKNKMKK